MNSPIRRFWSDLGTAAQFFGLLIALMMAAQARPSLADVLQSGDSNSEDLEKSQVDALEASDVSGSVSAELETLARSEDELQIPLPTTPGRPNPSSAVPGGRRDSCKLPKALIPEGQLGLTAFAETTLFFHNPNLSPHQAELKLFLNSELIATENVSFDRVGVVPHSLKSLKLQPAVTYRWQLTLLCSKQNLTKNTIEGTIQYIQLSAELNHLLQQSSPRQQAEILSAEGYWYSAIAALSQVGKLSLIDPDDHWLPITWERLIVESPEI